MDWEKFTKGLQVLGAVLAVPAGAAGAYQAYRTYFSADVACQGLRSAIVATMEKNMALDAKRALLRKDVADFEKTCGEIDPDARAYFLGMVQQQAAAPSGAAAPATPSPAAPPPPAAAAAAPPAARPPAAPVSAPKAAAPAAPAASAAAPPPPPPSPATAPAAVALPRPSVTPPQAAPPPSAQPVARPAAPVTAPARPPSATANVAGSAASGERRGWVALARRGTGRFAEVNFDGYAITATAPPPAGTVLAARWPVPVWAAPQDGGGRPDLATARAMLRAGMCVKVVSTRAGADRLWAEVQQAACR